VLLCGCSAAAQAQNGAPPKTSLEAADAAEAARAAQDEVLVIGHRQHGAVATAIQPEVTINQTAIKALGAADLNEVFRELAPEIGNGATAAVAPGTPPVVLVNGQRIAGFSAIKDFPPEAVRRIEVFPPQVALEYGYSPDQKVVNVVLRTTYRALTLLGRYTAAPSNWRGIYRAKIDLMRIDEDSHWNLALDYQHLDPLYADSTLGGPPPAPASPVEHTLAAQEDHLTTSGALTRKFGAVSAEFTATVDLGAVQSRPGLSEEDGDLLEQEGMTDLIAGPLERVDRTVDAQAGVTLNGKTGGWRWSFVGKLDDTTRRTTTEDAAQAARLDAILLPSPTMLGDRCGTGPDGHCVSTETRTASGDLYLNGNLIPLPAGNVSASFRTGFAYSGIRSVSPLVAQYADRDRDEASVQLNLNIPVLSPRSGIGKLTVGINGEAERVSDFGTLPTLGATIDWTPARPVEILGWVSRTRTAPSLLELEQGTLGTPDLREFDFVTNRTTIIDRLEGGNGALAPETTRIADLRVMLTPLRRIDLALSADYKIERTRNPIANLTAATAAAMAAFPDRFARADSYLTTLDTSPVNLARRDRQQVRWGVTYATSFGAAWPNKDGSPPDPSKPAAHNQIQIGLYDTWRLQDDVVLRQGQPTLDLLGGDIISDMGATPDHRVELQTTLSTRAWSIDVSAAWQNPTTAFAGPLMQDRLTFSQGVTVDVRLLIDLANQHWLTRMLPFLRGSLNLSASNILGAHTKVRDATGMVPAAYESSYLNPTGRTFRITLRKRFR